MKPSGNIYSRAIGGFKRMRSHAWNIGQEWIRGQRQMGHSCTAFPLAMVASRDTSGRAHAEDIRVDAGTYQVRLDGKVVGPEFDLGGAGSLDQIAQHADKSFYEYSRYAARLEEIAVGRQVLTKGNHELSFEAIQAGRNGRFALPIDAIRLRKVE